VDKIINLLGEKGAGFFKVKSEREKKKVSDLIPQPENQVNLENYRLEMEETTKKELEAKAQNIFVSVNNEISSVWSKNLFLETVRKRVMALPYAERMAVLPYIQKGAEAIIYQMEFDAWGKRSADVDRNIRGYESGFPKPFDIGMMNSGDYPKERIGFADNKPFDKWLTEALGEKRPIFFEPYERWGEKLSECYEKVYLKEYQKDQDLLHPLKAAAKPEPPPPPPPEQSQAIAEFYEMGNEEPGTLQGRIRSRIYKGGK
jgi:hypothetical protein